MDDEIRVVIGMDPHKRSVTIEVMTGDEQVLGGGRFATEVEGFAAMLGYVAAWPNRVGAIEGCEGIGRHVAQRLLAQGEKVVDVPAKLFSKEITVGMSAPPIRITSIAPNTSETRMTIGKRIARPGSITRIPTMTRAEQRMATFTTF